MTTIASQITSLAIVYPTVYSDADHRKHQSSASLAFVWEIHRDRWIPRKKGQLRGKWFHLMTSSWVTWFLKPQLMINRIAYQWSDMHRSMTNDVDAKYLFLLNHYSDVIMGTIASQITSLTIVYSTVYSDADHRKHQSSASLAFVWGIHRDRWIPRTKGQLRGKWFHLMTSLWVTWFLKPQLMINRVAYQWSDMHRSMMNDVDAKYLFLLNIVKYMQAVWMCFV